ncbi:hypothetical protein KDAU_51530 [Dictyobacter aurantiacus]|uniref:Uncharacterized protein n=1 Tax=Dictyobacter aurantiacus TaxID=1936993 RepID=A0A401ZLX7_9CHLR|nr:hypothetical protein KDAU_51530 [Dictyobacter aurantiacus]
MCVSFVALFVLRRNARGIPRSENRDDIEHVFTVSGEGGSQDLPLVSLGFVSWLRTPVHSLRGVGVAFRVDEAGGVHGWEWVNEPERGCERIHEGGERGKKARA